MVNKLTIIYLVLGGIVFNADAFQFSANKNTPEVLPQTEPLPGA